jgi:glutaconate CoA-transferase subunit A
VPNGAWPSYASDFYERDNNQYIAWDDISKDRDRFTEWLNSEIYSKSSAGK